MLDKAFLEITNTCNLACDFCAGTARAPRRMSEDEFERLTDRLTGRVRYLYFHLMGEPTTHPLLADFARRAREKGFRPMLTTNGTRLGAVGEGLLGAPFHKISISLHAPAANAAFADPHYFDHCIDFARRAAARGIITVLRLWNVGGTAYERENAPILARLHAEFDGEWGEIRSGYRMAERLFLEWGTRFAWPHPDASALPPDAPCFCYALRDQIGVLADGTVVPCCLDAEGRLALGNLHESELDAILSSPRARALYEGFGAHRAVESLCRRCGYIQAHAYRQK
ncbi:MAG: radical SAM protein [Clostridia bacterium]|nr:radical SAM protein [Clostridia bacterium]